MSIRRSLKGTQSRARVLAFRVDGSAVTTSAAATGLLEGEFDATVVKGTAGAANEVTFAWTPVYKRVPVVVATPITTGVHIEIKSVTATGCVIETFSVADGTTISSDADFHMLVMGWDVSDKYNIDATS